MFAPEMLARQAADLVYALSVAGKTALLASIRNAVIGRRHNGTALLF